jgi:outer membrane immunogenic protein
MRAKYLVAGAATALIFALQAQAADLPVKAPMYKAPVAPIFSWSGFYVGGNVGYGWGSVKPDTISFYQPITTLVAQIAGIDHNMDGVIGGGQVGYNYQMGTWVFGLEADISATGMKGSVTDSVNGYNAESKLNWLATGRGRIGFTYNRMLAYATGGVAVGEVKATVNDFYPSGTVTTTSAATHVGWTVGAGVESALWQNWSVKVEYLYVDLGSKDQNFYEPAGGWPRIQAPASVTANIVRAGINYRF